MSERVLETRICTHCSSSFDITDIDQDFLTRLSPAIAWIQYTLPFPTHCPKCRKTRRYAWRNEKNLYKRKCDATGKEIISLFSPDAPCPVYESDYWYSDQWDALQYGRDYDFSRPFFEQWEELKKLVPMPGKSIWRSMENSMYSDNCNSLKNCYLCFNASECENCHYSNDLYVSTSSIDSIGILKCQESYELANAYSCYATHHSFDVKNCRSSMFLYNCDGCEYCYGGHHMKNQKYMIFGEQYEEKEYFEKLKELQGQDLKSQKNLFLEFLRKTGYKHEPIENIWAEGVYESYEVRESKNVSFSGTIHESEDIRYCRWLRDVRLAMDVDLWGDRLDHSYESMVIGEACNSSYFSLYSWQNVSDLYYSAFCVGNVRNCFGCIWLRSAEYCILNQQYTKGEYEKLIPEIIEHMRKTWEWWEFFPARLSHFGYNQTMNMVKYPLTKEEVLGSDSSPKIGEVGMGVQDNTPPLTPPHWGGESETFLHWPTFNWSDYESPFPKVEKIIPAEKLPDDISKIPDDILAWAIECEVSKKPFRIMRSELEFYRKHSLPIPRKHPDVRYIERTKIYMNY